MPNLIARHILTKKLASNFWYLLLLLGFPLAGCQSTTPNLSTPATSLIPTTRTIAIPTSTSSPTVTPALDTPNVTPQPTDTAEPDPTPLSSDTPTPPSWQIAGSGYFLLYEAGTSVKQPEIYMLRPGEPSSRFVAYGDLIDGQPWSPDGMRLVFKNQPSPQQTDADQQFAIANLSTGEISILELNEANPLIFWSPDGKYLLYQARQEQDGLAQIVLYNLADKTNKIIYEGPHIFSLRGWSFDSQKIAFVSEMSGQYDLYTLDVTTLDLEKITDSIEVETVAVWSPNEMTLVLGTSTYSEPVLRHGPPFAVNSLVLKNMTDSSERLLGNYDSIVSGSVSWSPDGSKIAYSEDGNLCILDIANDIVECPLEEEPFGIKYTATEVPPSWSTDVEWLAFRASGSTQCPVVYFLELQTGNVIPADLDRCRTSPIYWSQSLIIVTPSD